MGVSISGEYREIDSMVKELEEKEEVQKAMKAGKMHPAELLELICPSFGVVHAGTFFTVGNEYYEDYDPSSNFSSLVARYYGIMDYGTISWYANMDFFGQGVMAEDVAEELGLELIDEHEEE